MIEGISIAKYFEKIYASSFYYNDKGVAVWPAQVVNYTNKTQFLFRIEKGVLDVKEFDYFAEWVRCSLDGTYATKLDEVKAEVLAKIDAYDTSSEVNSFSLNGLPVWLDKDTRVGLMNSTQIEKAAGHETTTLWLGSVSLVINCDLAIQMLSSLELYALECYNKTAEHKANVGKLMSIEEVEAYDYTTGYPDKLDLNTSGV